MLAETERADSNLLLYRAARAGIFGRQRKFGSGSITDALFVYLDGDPSAESTCVLDREYRGRPLVCLTASWEQYLREAYPGAKVYCRYRMKPAAQFRFDGEKRLPQGFEVAAFDEAAFERSPFSHGKNYPSFAAFCREGVGAVVWHRGEIMASASSFLSLEGEVELDVSTVESCRGKGLATACISRMLRECQERGITVHWDAQNEISAHLAKKFGFAQECCYEVLILPIETADKLSETL